MSYESTVRFLVVAIVVIGLAQVAPEIVNWILLLILIGVLLYNWQPFGNFIQYLTNIGK